MELAAAFRPRRASHVISTARHLLSYPTSPVPGISPSAMPTATAAKFHARSASNAGSKRAAKVLQQQASGHTITRPTATGPTTTSPTTRLLKSFMVVFRFPEFKLDANYLVANKLYSLHAHLGRLRRGRGCVLLCLQSKGGLRTQQGKCRGLQKKMAFLPILSRRKPG